MRVAPRRGSLSDRIANWQLRRRTKRSPGTPRGGIERNTKLQVNTMRSDASRLQPCVSDATRFSQ
eukprot:7117130-Prymnesium_polylepis.1